MRWLYTKGWKKYPVEKGGPPPRREWLLRPYVSAWTSWYVCKNRQVCVCRTFNSTKASWSPKKYRWKTGVEHREESSATMKSTTKVSRADDRQRKRKVRARSACSGQRGTQLGAKKRGWTLERNGMGRFSTIHLGKIRPRGYISPAFLRSTSLWPQVSLSRTMLGRSSTPGFMQLRSVESSQ